MALTVRFHRYGGPDVLRVEDLPIEPPGLGEVQIRARALGLNRADILMRSGTYIETAAFPSGLGLEMAGTIEAIGAGVEGFAVGDEVNNIPPISMVRHPVHAQLANVPAELAVRKPPNLGWTEAAAVWMQYLTAYGAIADTAKLAPGESILVTAASSGTGIAAIQIANAIGARPIAVTRSASKRSALLSYGAADVIVLVDEDPLAHVHSIAGAAGVRVILDPIGGSSLRWMASALAPGGILISYGMFDSSPAPFPQFEVLAKSLTIKGFLVHEVVRDPARLTLAKRFILDGLETGLLRPVVAQTFPLAQIAKAHRHVESNMHLGKVVVTI